MSLLTTAALSAADVSAIRRLLDAAFAGDLSEDDWAHALGGWHALVRDGEAVVAHAAVVERPLDVADRRFRTGYVEAVATAPDRQRSGLGSAVMAAVNDLIGSRFDLGALSSGEWGFYERLGWERWRGPAWVRAADGTRIRTPEEDDGVMVLRCGPSRDIDLAAAITCDARSGDAW